MIICICHRVSDRDIARAVRQGCDNFDDLHSDLGVATACGKCHDCALPTLTLQRVLQGRAGAPSCAGAGAAATAGLPRAWPPRNAAVQAGV
jgi:bacterioferritin-associated ferredoxin